jgi:hypothetical protein
MNPPTFRKISEVSGKGAFSFDTFEKEASFKIEFYIGKEALVFLDESFFSGLNVKLANLHKPIEASLSGNLNNGSKIHIDKIILINVAGLKKGTSTPIKFKVFSPIVVSNESLKPIKGKTEIHYYITNFEFIGCEKTFYPKGGFKSDHFSVSFEGHNFNIKQVENYKEIIEHLKKHKTSLITAEIIVKADLKERDKLYPVITNMCDLLSLATGNSVVPITEKHFSNGKFVWAQTTSMRVDNFRPGDPLIPELPPDAIRDFTIKTYPNYAKLKDNLGLNTLLDYYLLMKSNPVLDVECLLGFILLECLSNNAQEFYSKEGKPVENNMKKSKISRFNKILPKSNNLSKKTKDKLIEEFVSPFPSLQDSINRVMAEFGMKYKKKEAEIWKLRKEFIHKGTYPKQTINRVQVYRNIVHFIDRLLLHILNYNGEFLNIAEGYKTEKIEHAGNVI